MQAQIKTIAQSGKNRFIHLSDSAAVVKQKAEGYAFALAGESSGAESWEMIGEQRLHCFLRLRIEASVVNNNNTLFLIHFSGWEGSFAFWFRYALKLYMARICITFFLPSPFSSTFC